MKKRRRTTKKPYSRSIVGATLEVIQKKRTEKAEVRDAAREAALRYGLLFFSHSSLLLLFLLSLLCSNLDVWMFSLSGDFWRGWHVYGIFLIPRLLIFICS